MIGGIVEADEARIELTVQGPRGQSRIIEAVIDSGFSSWLTLPSAVINSLSLPWFGAGDAVLADGSTGQYDIFEATVIWDGRVCPVFVDDADTEPLIGMKLMRGYELKMQIRDGGQVTLKRLAR
jgi:clan AA aspartic protease